MESGDMQGFGTGRARVSGNGNAKVRDPRQRQIPIYTGKKTRLLRKSTASGIHVGFQPEAVRPSLVCLWFGTDKVARGPEYLKQNNRSVMAVGLALGRANGIASHAQAVNKRADLG